MAENKTHLEKVDQTPRNYFGICYYNHIGSVVHETGHHDRASFDKLRDDSNRSLAGKWSFAILKTRDVRDVWSCACIFPDGDMKVLTSGQVAVTAPKSRGKWVDYNRAINLANMIKYPGSVRFAMDSRIPWKQTGVTLRTERFTDEEALAKWISAQDPVRSVIFIANPSQTNLPPDEEALFMMCVVVDA